MPPGSRLFLTETRPASTWQGSQVQSLSCPPSAPKQINRLQKSADIGSHSIVLDRTRIARAQPRMSLRVERNIPALILAQLALSL